MINNINVILRSFYPTVAVKHIIPALKKEHIYGHHLYILCSVKLLYVSRWLYLAVIPLGGQSFRGQELFQLKKQTHSLVSEDKSLSKSTWNN